MTNINLLPWREWRREREKKRYVVYLSLVLGFAFFCVFLLNSYATGLVDRQLNQNKILQQEIDQYQLKIQEIAKLKALRESLMARMIIVQKLLMMRGVVVHLFDELVNVIPKGVYITRVERIGEGVNLQGFSESNADISELMRNIDNDDWLQSPELLEIKESKEGKSAVPNAFSLRFLIGPNISGLPPLLQLPGGVHGKN